MYCPKCGAQNQEGAQVCSSCSFALTEISTTGEPLEVRTSGLAIAALVLGLLSACTMFLTALPAIILGIIGLIKITQSKGKLKGMGLAIAGMAIPVVLLPIAALMMGIMMPALARTRSVAQRMVCGTNLSGLGKAIMIYSNDYDRFPTSSKWCDLLIEYVDVTEMQFRCRSDKDARCSYAMNKNIEGLDLNKIDPDTVLLFESVDGWNQSGGPELLNTDNHFEGCNILFADGHAKFVKSSYLEDLKWTTVERE